MTAPTRPPLVVWNLDTSGHYTSKDGRFELYPERLPENDNRLTWTLIDRDGVEGVENGHDSHEAALDRATRLAAAADADRVHGYALDEAVDRAIHTNRHDDGLILALHAAGHSPWEIAAWLGISDRYVTNTVRHVEAASA